MEDDWEALADKDNVVIRPKLKNINKWAGEDADDDEDVKDSWENEEEEKKDEEKNEVKPPVKVKPKKTLQEKISEKERQKIEVKSEEDLTEIMTPEERLAEKLRLQKIQEEEDLKHALDTFGIEMKIDDMSPKNKIEFSELSDAISKKVMQFKSADEFPSFIEELVRSICANLTVADLRKIKSTVDNLHLEKQKMEKEKTKKVAGKGKSKVKLRMDEESLKSNNIGDYDYGGGYEEFDDFM